MEQRTPEWRQARCGRITGTRFAAAMSSPDTATYRHLIDDLVTERRTGRPIERPMTRAMQWGIDYERAARAWYVHASGNKVDQVAFVEHPSLDFVGVSPDGLVSQFGLLEIKCPQRRAFDEFSSTQRVPPRYGWQLQGQLWVCQRTFVDFVCFHPDVGGRVIRVDRNERLVRQLHDRCVQVDADVRHRLRTTSGSASRKIMVSPAEAEPSIPVRRSRLSAVPFWL